MAYILFITKFSMNDHQNFNFKVHLKITNYFIDFIIKSNVISTKMSQNHQNIYYFPITKLLYSVTKLIYLNSVWIWWSINGSL